MDVHLASLCYSVAMKLSNLMHSFQAGRILTSNKQVDALFTNRMCTFN